MAWRPDKVVVKRNSLNACVENAGRRATSESVSPERERIGWLLVGEIVVRTSAALAKLASSPP